MNCYTSLTHCIDIAGITGNIRQKQDYVSLAFMAWQIGDKVCVHNPSGVVISPCEIVNITPAGSCKVVDLTTGDHWLAGADEIACYYYINDMSGELCDLFDPNIRRCDNCPDKE